MAKKTPVFRIALSAAIAALVFVLVPAALAGKGGTSGKPSGGGSTGSYSATVSPAGPYNFGQQIYITTTAPIDSSPYIWLKCYQNGALVASGDHAAFPSGWYYNWPFNLGPTLSWKGGAADCTVQVVHVSNNKVVTDATTSFHVNA